MLRSLGIKEDKQDMARAALARAILKQAAELPLARRHELLRAAALKVEFAAVFEPSGAQVVEVVGLKHQLQALAQQVRRSPQPMEVDSGAVAGVGQGATAAAATQGATAAAATQDALKLAIVPEYELYGNGMEEAVRAVISITAVAEVPQRAQVALTCVLDRSSSMGGELIQLVRETCHFLIDQLTPNDYLGLCSYAGDVREDLPLLRMTPEARALAHLVVENLEANGSTALYDGLVMGVRQQMDADLELKGDQSRVVHSCFLFTDGQATHGPTRPADIVEFLKAMQAPTNQNVTVHTFGFGDGHSVGLLQEVAEAQSGVYYYIRCSDDIAGGFGDALGGLLAVVAKDVRVEVRPQPNVALTAFRSGGRVLGAAGKSSGGQRAPTTSGGAPGGAAAAAPTGAAFNDMFAEESRECLVVLGLAPPAAAGQQQQPGVTTDLAQVDLEYTDMSSGLRVHRSLVLRVLRTAEPRPAGQLPAELVFVTAARFETLDAIEEAQRAANEDDGRDVSGAQSVLDRHLGRLQQSPLQLPQLEALSEQTRVARQSIKPRFEFNQTGIAAVAGTVQALKHQRVATSTMASPAYFAEYDKKCKLAYRQSATTAISLQYKSKAPAPAARPTQPAQRQTSHSRAT